MAGPAIRQLRRLLRDSNGNAAILTAMAMPAVLGMTTMAVDLGSLYLAERQLQGVADAAVASVVRGDLETPDQNVVNQMIARSGLDDVQITELVPGEYRRDIEIAPADRFEANAETRNAARLELSRRVPLFFGSVLLGEDATEVRVRATAARSDMAAFNLGSHLVGVGGGLPNSLLGALSGRAVNFSDDDIALLANGRIDVLTFAEQLRDAQEQGDATFGESFDTATPLFDIVNAMAASVPDTELGALLAAIAADLGEDQVVLSDLIDLGPVRNADVNDGTLGVSVDAYALLRSVLEASFGDSYEVTLEAGAGDLAGAEIKIAGGHGYEQSPWLTLTEAADVVLRTAQTRIQVKVEADAGLAQLSVPVFTELAPATAQITDIACEGPSEDHAVTVDVTASVGKLAIAETDDAMFSDFTQPLWLEPARIAAIPLLRVDAFSDIDMGGHSVQQVEFTREEIDDEERKAVPTSDLTEALFVSLVENAELDVRMLGFTLGLNELLVENAVLDTLVVLSPAIDGLVNDLSRAAGVQIGVAEVGVDRLRCGQPSIIG